MFKELLHTFAVKTHFIVVIRRHGKKVVNTQPVTGFQVFPRIDRILSFHHVRIEADRIEVQVFESENILLRRSRICKIDMLHHRIRQHPVTCFQTVQAEFAVFDPRFTEAELTLRQCIRRCAVYIQRKNLRVKLRIFRTPQNRIFPCFRELHSLEFFSIEHKRMTERPFIFSVPEPENQLRFSADTRRI